MLLEMMFLVWCWMIFLLLLLMLQVLLLFLKRISLNFLLNIVPIVLFNVIYKLVSKVLTHMLKPILDDIIDLLQSSFIAGRSIFDNIMAAHEVVHVMKNKRRDNNGFVAEATDMSKTYNRIK